MRTTRTGGAGRALLLSLRLPAIPDCGGTYYEFFIAGTEPTEDTYFVPFPIHRETGLLATPQTPQDEVEERVFFVIPPKSTSRGSARLGQAGRTYPSRQPRRTSRRR